MAPAIPYIALAATAASAGASIYQAVKGGPSVPKPPAPPNQDTAANATLQQAELMRRRRGVLSNIYGGNNPVLPQVSGKSTLGS